MRMIDENEVGLKEKPEDTRYIYQKDYIKIRTEAPGVRANDMIPNFAITGNYRLETDQVVTRWRVLGGGEIKTQVHHLPRDCWL